MRKTFVSVVALACLVGLAGGTLIANAGADITAPETFTVIGTTIRDRFADVGKHGFSSGDTFSSVERMTNEADDTRVGTGRIRCTVHIGPWAICVGTFAIDDRGEIIAEGMVPLSEDVTTFDVPVTGGTGDFANVRGEVHVEPLSETEERDTFELIP
jgi:hypothetical protein